MRMQSFIAALNFIQPRPDHRFGRRLFARCLFQACLDFRREV